MKNKICTFFELGLILAILISLSSCYSTQKQLDGGNNDTVINHSVRKITGKKNKSPKHVKAIESALDRANRTDLQKINQLEISAVRDRDVQILALYDKINSRQNRIQPLLPLIDKKGYEAQFQFVKTLGKQAEYQNKAADYLYTNAITLAEKARKGDKKAARQAFDEIIQTEKLIGEYKNSRSLKGEMRDLGTLYIEVAPSLGKNVIMSKEVADLFLNFNYPEIQADWKVVHYNAQPGRLYDLTASFILESFEVTPEREKTREYQDSKKIKIDQRKDQNGKVIPNSGREITVTAKVIELLQTKEAIVNGRIIVTDKKAARQVYSQNYHSRELFENYASTYTGDKRALSDVTLKNIGGKPLPFPRNEQMLLNGTENLKRELINLMRKWYDTY